MNQYYFILFYFCCLGSTNLFSQIVNEGSIQIKPLTIVYFGEEYTNKTTGIHNNNGELYLNNDFINDGITSANLGTTFFNSSTNNIQTISGLTENVNLFNLVVDNSLTGVKVVDNFGLIVSNAVNLIDGDLRLTGDAQLIQTHIGTNLNSAVSGKLLKDQQGNFSVYAYNYWSSPVNNSGAFSISGGLFDGTDSNLNPFSPQQILFNSGSPYNGIPSVIDGGGNVTIPLTINTYWLYKYFTDSGNAANWVKINENSIINPGEGYLMKGTNTANTNQNYVFKGVPNDGAYQFPISTEEYLLIGNPYPSAIDIDEFIKDNISVSSGGYGASDVIYGTLYFWVDGGTTSHNSSDYYGGYATRNLTAGAPPSSNAQLGTSEFAQAPTQYMGVAQGFFVNAIGDGNVIFKNSQRIFKTESSGESVHYKNSDQNITTEKSFLRIGYDDPLGFHRQLVLGFIPNSPADIGFNTAYDASMFDYRENDLFFIIDNKTDFRYIIQGVGTFNDAMKLPLGLSITEEGMHTVVLDTTENFNNIVYIEDKLLETTHDLSESQFEINLPPGEYLDRFQLVFQSKNTLDINQFDLKEINVYYNGNNEIIIDNHNSLKLNKVAIFNVLGQKILELNSNLLVQEEIAIPFRKKIGVYLIKIESDQGEKTYKILKK